MAKSIDVLKIFEGAIVVIYAALLILWAVFSQFDPAAAYEFVLASRVIEFLPDLFLEPLWGNFEALSEAEGIAVAQSFFSVQVLCILALPMFVLPAVVLTSISGISNFNSFKSDLRSTDKSPTYYIVFWIILLVFSSILFYWALFSPDYFLTWRNDYTMFHRPGIHSLILLGLVFFGGAASIVFSLIYVIAALSLKIK
jgi:hypothetical protein